MTRNFIVVEGPIGVGKTTLAKKLAESFAYELLLESADDNPFLEQFYQAPELVAFQTQLFFLFQRAKQLQEIRQADLFRPVRVADFIMEKDRIFAQVTLNDDEYKLYEQVYEYVTIDAPVPDLVIYLQAPADILQKRVNKRDRSYERQLSMKYLDKLVEKYTDFFYNYTQSPLLIVNAAEINFAENDDDYQLLLEQINRITTGRHYFNPTPALAL
ncbi:Deoxyadenosine kinase @ Deoxyguanosine kinase [hydrothermal vent metagenome]|uniref:Deoxyadenosine kinase @ Deoxyguanosine kinase n=1 Tax=hydrothermal vent metagenome TaxID=652676 RepID=A0A3B0ZUE0_9ZZZZ